MEMNRNQRTQTQIQLITKLVLPFSVLYVILSYPFLCNFEVLAYSVELRPLNFSVGKNYMFLVCIGILVFIAPRSGLIGSSSSVENDCETEKIKEFNQREKLEVDVSEQGVSTAKAEFVKEAAEEAKMESLVVKYEGDENGNDWLVSVEEEEEEEEAMSNEELNKKCEEFIRKMREQIHNNDSTQFRM